MLEQKIEELTKAVQENTEALKAAGKPAPAKPGRPRGSGAKTQQQAPAKLTVAQVRKAASEYVNREKTKDGQKRLTNTVRPVAAALGVAALKDISEDQCEEAKGYIDQLEAAYAEGGVEAAEAVQIGEAAEEESPL